MKYLLIQLATKIMHRLSRHLCFVRERNNGSRCLVTQHFYAVQYFTTADFCFSVGLSEQWYYRFTRFWKTIIMDANGPLGKVKDYYYRYVYLLL